MRHGAWRVLRAHPGLASAVVVTLALTLGANTAVFSLVNAVLLRPLPVAEPDRLVFVDRRAPDGSLEGFTFADYRALREAAAPVVALAGTRDHGFVVDGGAGLVGGLLVTGSYFEVLGVRPQRGRLLSTDDDAPGRPPVAVIGHALWQRAFGGDPSVVGRTIRLNGHPFAVVGVAPPRFEGHFVAFPFDLWVPSARAADVGALRAHSGPDALHLELLGRLAPGRSPEQARDALRTLDAGLMSTRPSGTVMHPVDTRPMDGIDEELRRPVVAFLGVFEAAAFLVLIAGCANVATLLLVRGAARRREMAIRVALGAGRGVLVRQLMAETGLLFAAGAAGGLWLAHATADLIMGFQPAFAIPLRLDLGLDVRVVAFSLAVTFLAAAGFGLAPALRTARVDAVTALKDSGPTATGHGRLRRAFVFAQVLVAAVLLALSGVFVRTMQRSLTAETGLDARGVALASFNPGLVGRDERAGRAFYADLLSRVAARPDVEAVALARRVPLGGGRLTTEIPSPGPAGSKDRVVTADFNAVTPGYLSLLRIPLLRGRDFAATDAKDAAAVAIVNESLAARLWPARDPLGQLVEHGGTPRRVVGVARDSAYRSPGEAPRPHLYVPFAQDYAPGMAILARGTGEAGALVAALRSAARTVDGDVPVLTALTMRERLLSSFAPHRLAATLAGAMAALALLLAAVGLHGVVAFSVGRRVREFGIRSALGARPREILRLVLGEGLGLSAAAAGMGLLAGALLGEAVRKLLPGVAGADAVTLAAVAAIVLAVAVLSTFAPARRAAGVDPAVALRYE
jgi:predicted permease